MPYHSLHSDITPSVAQRTILAFSGQTPVGHVHGKLLTSCSLSGLYPAFRLTLQVHPLILWRKLGHRVFYRGQSGLRISL